MLEKLEQCFKRLQSLDIQPTKNNMEKLLQTLYDLQAVYNELRGGDGGDGTAVDSE